MIDVKQIKNLPARPGVYLFKDTDGQILYVGKAKNLKKRGAQYVQRVGIDVKVDSIFASSVLIDHIETANELEALLLEAKLIASNQPKFNVLLKSGQPFVYLFISSGKLPELKMVRSQKQKGTYFGPFLEKTSARKVYAFLVKTFRLKLCKKKIENGCLDYHMGLCAGSCRSDFDQGAYGERIALAKLSLQQGHKKFLAELKTQIEQHNTKLEYEKSRQLHEYYKAFEQVFAAIDHKPADLDAVAGKDLWIQTPDRQALFVFRERAGALTKRRVFYFPLQPATAEDLQEYFLSYYRIFAPSATIVLNFDLQDDYDAYQDFLAQWHNKDYAITIVQQPEQGHNAALVRLATIQAQQDIEKQYSVPLLLKRMLKLPVAPHTIDCFDISHKQGRYMVGSCVRFLDGKPDQKNFRHFHIKTLTQQDDYAALREIVERRYKDAQDLPDLILIDGGKGQLNAVIDLFPDAEFASLAKREETVFSRRLSAAGKKLDQKNPAAQLLIALRDYAHHFAISFHRQTERHDQ